jgi:hypothetical protein
MLPQDLLARGVLLALGGSRGVVVEKTQRSYVFGWLLEVVEVDDRIAGVAPDAENAAHSCGEPATAIHVCEPIGLSTLLASTLLALVVQGAEFEVARHAFL